MTQKVNPWSVVPWGKVNSENVSPEDLAHAKLSAQNLARDVIIDASHAPAAPTAPAPLAPAEQIASLAETHAGREVKEIADDELAKLLDIAGQFKAFLADVEAEAKRRLMAGGLQGRGWKMVAGKRARKLKVDEDELVLTLRETWKLPKDDVRDKDGNITKQGVMQTKLKSLAQLDGVVSNLSKARQKKFAEMWEWRTGPPVLAPESDPADAVNPRPELLDGADEDPSENTVNVGNALTPEQAAAGSAPMEDPPSWY